MRSKKTWLAGSVLVLLIGASLVVAQKTASIADLKPIIEERFPRAKWISQQQLVSRLKKKKPTLLLDARTTAEYNVSHLKSAKRIDPDKPKFSSLPKAEDVACVVVYCSVGYRSGDIAQQLIDKGYKSKNLEGGIFAWANAGRQVYRSSEKATLVHPYDAVWGKLLNANLRAPLD